MRAVALLAGAALAAGCDAPRAGTVDTARAATAPVAPPAPAPVAGPAIACVDGEGAARRCTVDGLFADQPDLRLTLATGAGVPDTLVVAVARAGAAPVRLPTFYGSRLWGQCAPAADERDRPRADRLAAVDVDGDRRADLVVLAQCMTGIGPTGAQPFPAGAVYLADGAGGWRSAEPVDSAFTDLAQAECGEAAGGEAACDLPALAREAVRRVGRPSGASP